jgi:stage II sporulation protein M
MVAILSTFNNGFAIGMLFNFVGKMHGVGIVILQLMPHGIIEIPALLISASIGLRIGHI